MPETQPPQPPPRVRPGQPADPGQEEGIQDQGSLDEPVADVGEYSAPNKHVENAAELGAADGDEDVDRAVSAPSNGMNVPRERFPWEGDPSAGR